MKSTLPLAQIELTKALIEVTDFCEKHKICYWLDSGTLLGAVRHNGFIPWDDDIDICMPRKDFNKFLELASNGISNNLFLQTMQSDPYYKFWEIPCKVRINNSLIIEKWKLESNTYDSRSHNGLFIDILPIDFSPTSPFFDLGIFLLNSIYKIKFINTKYGNRRLRKLLKFMGFFFPIFILNFLQKLLINHLNGDQYIYGIELPFKRRYFDYNDIYPLSKILFEGHEFSCPNETHTYLTKLYGSDYMQLPPIENRVNHSHKIEIY